MTTPERNAANAKAGDFHRINATLITIMRYTETKATLIDGFMQYELTFDWGTKRKHIARVFEHPLATFEIRDAARLVCIAGTLEQAMVEAWRLILGSALADKERE